MSWREELRVHNSRSVTVAACTLNQWALDFEGNLSRIIKSIQKAKDQGATFRSGPELEISGYSCEDHFFESDTVLHSWEAVVSLLRSETCQDILVDVGMPVMYKNVMYNCRVILYNNQVMLIRPKMLLADEGNYRESRWFSRWKKFRTCEDFTLPDMVQKQTGQKTAAFGDAVITTLDSSIGFEICEEMWNPHSTNIFLGIDGVEIISNSSGSYTELRKAYVTVDNVKSASLKSGGCYMFSNLRGCDGQRVFFNGCSCIAINGSIVSRGNQFSLREIEVVLSTFDLEDIRTYRNSLRSRSNLSSEMQAYPRVHVNFHLSHQTRFSAPAPPVPINWTYLTPEEEISWGPACWLWDYLRRSNQGGYFLPLSGGVDSASTATIVYCMCCLIFDAIRLHDSVALSDLRRIVGDPEYKPSSAKELCGRLFFTCYLGTDNSSAETKARAQALAQQIGSNHQSLGIDVAVSAILGIFTSFSGRQPLFQSQGGSVRESLALQNVQARVRMVISYLLAQLMLWTRGRPGGLLVLGSSNVDEALRGYMTKYDCSSADVNPIGGISKKDLRSFLVFAEKRFNLPALKEISQAVPTAELEPLNNGELVQTDEQDMGMTYDELATFGRLRKQAMCGPYSMFLKLLHVWRNTTSPELIAEKVKHFFRCYAINRHKMTVLTPSYHAESYSPDDNRFDLRPFLYNITWKWQFKAIDDQLAAMNDPTYWDKPVQSDPTKERSTVVKSRQTDSRTELRGATFTKVSNVDSHLGVSVPNSAGSWSDNCGQSMMIK